MKDGSAVSGPSEDGPGTDVAAPDMATVRKAVIASAMDNCVEWFDFGVFSAGVITAIVGTVFFPPEEGGNATLRSFALIADDPGDGAGADRPGRNRERSETGGFRGTGASVC